MRFALCKINSKMKAIERRLEKQDIICKCEDCLKAYSDEIFFSTIQDVFIFSSKSIYSIYFSKIYFVCVL